MEATRVDAISNKGIFSTMGSRAARRWFVTALLSAAPIVRLAAQCPDGSPPPCRLPSTSSQLQIVERVPSLSVLYLANLSQDTTDAALADGITEELIARLSQIDGLRVTSLYAALRYRGRGAIDPKTVGRELGVRYVLHGTLRRAGAHIRVAVEVTEATTGYNLWAQTYDQGISDVFAMQDSVTIQVAAALRGRLTGPERKRLTPPQAHQQSRSVSGLRPGPRWGSSTKSPGRR
jgi:TolB-like protein